MAKYVAIAKSAVGVKLELYEAKDKQAVIDYLLSKMPYDMREDLKHYFTDGSIVIVEVDKEVKVN